MRALAFAVLACGACGPRGAPSNAKAPDTGITISLYRSGDESYGVVDDRRWVDVSGSTILLGNIDPGAALASLVIESSNPALRIGPCTRMRLPDDRDLERERAIADERKAVERLRAQREAELNARRYRDPRLYDQRIDVGGSGPSGKITVSPGPRFAPIVQCDVAGPPGRQLVRIVYVSTELGYRIQHAIAMRDPSKATIDSRYVFETPSWRERAEIAIFDGLPGGIDPPRELVRGQTTLDGGTSILGGGARDVPARLRRVFAGARVDEPEREDYTDANSVWVTLEVPNERLSIGPIRVHIELEDEDRWIEVDPKEWEWETHDEDGKPLNELSIKLWADEELRGTRQRMIVEDDGNRTVEVVALAMTNTGSVAREVWLEERARLAKRRSVERAWPKKPSAKGDLLRNKVVVKPGATERTGYTLVYEQ